MGKIIRLFVISFILTVSSCTYLKYEAVNFGEELNLFEKSETLDSSHELPTYPIYLDREAHERYKEVIEDKKELLSKFIDYLYGMKNFNNSMWIAKTIFQIVPNFLIRSYLGEDFYDTCEGIAYYSEREVHEIIVYNYMYEIGAANDFCTSIALTQTVEKLPNKNSSNSQKENLNILARNLDYGFQKFLGENTIRLDFYENTKSSKPFFTTLGHAGFVSSHTVLKYESEKNIQFGISLNQRKSGSYNETVERILFEGCESVFQLTNRILKTDISTSEELIRMVSESKYLLFYSRSCSSFYFIIQTKTGDNILIEKNYGVGVHEIYVKNESDRQQNDNISFILQTNTDIDKPDPDGRRDKAFQRINKAIAEKEYIEEKDIYNILLQPPNFNKLTIMTALMNIETGEIKAVVWENSENISNMELSKKYK